jgi:hypothetical protein
LSGISEQVLGATEAILKAPAGLLAESVRTALQQFVSSDFVVGSGAVIDASGKSTPSYPIVIHQPHSERASSTESPTTIPQIDAVAVFGFAPIAYVHHRLDDAVEEVFQPMRRVIVECLVEIFAPLCNPSFLPLVLGVRSVKCGKLRLCGLCCGVSLLVMVNSRIGHDCAPMPSTRRAVRARSGHKLTISPTVAIQLCGAEVGIESPVLASGF